MICRRIDADTIVEFGFNDPFLFNYFVVPW